MKLLVTGGAGFIGSNFIRYIINKYPEYQIVNLDLLTYAGNMDNLKDIETNSRYKFVKGNINDRNLVDRIMQENNIDTVVNFAAESHVDRSILDSKEFITTNISGTETLLRLSLENKISRYLQISTDEVYGSLGKTGFFTEQSPITPNSPYSASKAAADLIVRSYFKTYSLNTVITRSSNNYGPYQFAEKLIPLMITNAYKNINLPVYGDGKNIRDWIHVSDNCSGIDKVLHEGKAGEVYNLGGGNERKNIDIVRYILKKMNKPESLMQFVKDRLGHDRRYAIDYTKMEQRLGWKPEYHFEGGLDDTIDWYLDNINWWEKN